MSKILVSLGASLLALFLLVTMVNAQTTTPATTLPAANVTVASAASAASASVSQTVPVTLTLTISGPDGPLTVEVPLLMSLDIRIDISQNLTSGLVLTPSVDVDVATVITDLPDLDVVTPLTVTEVITPELTSPEDTTPATATPEPELATPTPLPTTPPVTEAPTATPEPLPTPTPAPVIAAAACPDNRSVISAPGMNQTLTGIVEVRGTAIHESFQYYKVEYAAGSGIDPNEAFAYLVDSRVSVSDGVLATFDSANLSNGAYTIKLTVVDNTGNFPPPCTVSVFIEN